MPDMVKCAGCGFLAVRHKQTRQLLDAELLLRERGYLLETDPVTGTTAYEPYPICFVQKLNFRIVVGNNPTEAILSATVREPRECDGFTEWQQGFTPKEHLEMIQEKDRLAWQKEREDADREFQSQQVARAEQFQADEAARADKRHKDDIDLYGRGQRAEWWRLFAAVVLGAILASGVPWFVKGKTSTDDSTKPKGQLVQSPPPASAEPPTETPPIQEPAGTPAK